MMQCVDDELHIEQLQAHLDIKKGDCPCSEIKCPYNIFGCSFVVRN